MIIDEISFHDSQILEVRETSNQTIDFLLEFPTNWENNVFEKRILRFTDVTNYHVEELPFAGQSTILEIVNSGQVRKSFGEGRNKIESIKHEATVITNAGKRTIEFSACELRTAKITKFDQ